jgi:hypothetical protein
VAAAQDALAAREKSVAEREAAYKVIHSVY